MSFLHGLFALLLYPLPYLLTLVIVVFVHEFGHYMAMRSFGVRVARFSVGVGRALFSFRLPFSRTEFRLCWIPFFGYLLACPVGDDGPARGRSYYDLLSPQRRLLVVMAGPVASLVFSALVLGGVYWRSGDMIGEPKVIALVPGGAAEDAGIHVGDRIVRVGLERIGELRDFSTAVMTGGAVPTVVGLVGPSGDFREVVLRPRYVSNPAFGGLRTPMAGVVGGPVRVVHYGILDALAHGFEMTARYMDLSILVVRESLSGALPSASTQGPLGATRSYHDAAQTGDPDRIFEMLAFASMSLGLINLFPLLPADGGMAMFLIVEWSARRPVSARVRDLTTRFGLAIVCVSVLVSVFIDLSSLAG